MGILTVIGALVGTVASAIVLGLIKDEATAWLPVITKLILKSAVCRLPCDVRDRFSEEWHSHVLEFPGKLTQLFQATSIWAGSFRMKAPKSSPTIADMERLFKRAWIVSILYFVTKFVDFGDGFLYYPFTAVHEVAGIINVYFLYFMIKHRRVVIDDLRKDLEYLRSLR